MYPTYSINQIYYKWLKCTFYYYNQKKVYKMLNQILYIFIDPLLCQ